MKERIETNTFQRAFLAFFLFLFVILASCGKKSSSNESPAAFPHSDPAFDVVAKEIQQTVKALEYPDGVGQDLVKMVSGWKCDVWKQKLDHARQDLQDKKISDALVEETEEEIIKELYHKVRKEIIIGDDFKDYDLGNIIKDKKAYCIGYCQLLYVLGNSIGLKIEVIDVLELATGSMPVAQKHAACLIHLTGSKVIMEDLALNFISDAFVFEKEFSKDGNYWILQDKHNRLGIHRKFQVWDRNRLIAIIYFGKKYEYMRLGKYSEAVSCCDKAIDLAPNYADLYISRGALYDSLGKYTEAISDFNKAIAIEPNYSLGYESLGIVFDHIGRSDDAISDFSKAIELDSKNAVAYCFRGDIFYRLHKNNEAISDLTKGLLMYRYYPNIISYNKAQRKESGLYANAVSNLTKAIQYDKNNLRAYIALGKGYDDLTKYKEAIFYYSKAIDVDPTNPNIYYKQARVYQKLGQYIEAIDGYTKVLDLDPYDANAYNGRGYSYYKLGRLADAISEYTEALDIDPKYIEVYNDRGLMYRKMSKYAEAIPDFSKAIELDPKNDKAYYNRGISEANIGIKEEAKKDLQKALDLDPSLKEKVKEISDKFQLGL